MTVVVEAENEDEAKEKSSRIAQPTGLCNYCSREIELGDAIEVAAINETDEELTED